MTIRHRLTIVATIGVFALLRGFAGAQDPPKKDQGVCKEESAPLRKSPVKKKQDGEKTDVLREAGELLTTDPLDPGRGRSAHYKAFTVKMSPGKTYVIRMIHERGGAGG